LLLGLLCQAGCAVPRHIWKQDDIRAQTVNEPSSRLRVLVASGRSDFKQAVIGRLRERFEPRGVYMKLVGLSGLEGEEPSAYGAVVVMTGCVAWGMDPRADAFLKKYGERPNIVLLATSGGGDWLPDRKGKEYDAVSSASKQTRVTEMAEEIGDKVDALLERD
jgi:hypothetical protein